MGKALYRAQISAVSWRDIQSARHERVEGPKNSLNDATKDMYDDALIATIVGWLGSHKEVIRGALNGNKSRGNTMTFLGEPADSHDHHRVARLKVGLSAEAGKRLFCHTFKVTHQWDQKRYSDLGATVFTITVLT